MPTCGFTSERRDPRPLAGQYDATVRSRVLGATVALAVLLVVIAACQTEDPDVAADRPSRRSNDEHGADDAAHDDHPASLLRGPARRHLFDIAKAHGLPVEAIMQANGMTDANVLLAGQVIQLPLATEYTTTTLPRPTTIPPTALLWYRRSLPRLAARDVVLAPLRPLERQDPPRHAPPSPPPVGRTRLRRARRRRPRCHSPSTWRSSTWTGRAVATPTSPDRLGRRRARLRGFWDKGKTDKDALWTSNAALVPSIQRYVDSVGATSVARHQARAPAA